MSYKPKGRATAQPMTMPIIGDQSRSDRGARSISRVTTASVTADAAGAAYGDADTPRGACVSISNTARMTVAAMSISTVPDTTGVMTRRSQDSRAATTNFSSDDSTTRLASIAGPPSVSAVMQMAIAGSDVPITSTCPMPTRPNRKACNKVVTPLTISIAKTAQVR